MLHAMAMLTVVLSAADHWTTYLCLSAPKEGWVVTEANPIADWMFSSMGLVPGLLIDSAVTLGAVFFLIATRRLSHPSKLFFFAFIAAWTGYAVINNVQAISSMGLSLLGSA
ncbi:MAG: DUF5658 family protein [Myxococcota bacterium]